MTGSERIALFNDAASLDYTAAVIDELISVCLWWNDTGKVNMK
jgi:hypothetical protein